MGRVVGLTLLVFALQPVYAAPQNTRPTAKKTTATTTRKATSASHSASLRPVAATNLRSAHGSVAHGAVARGRAGHPTHVAAGPSYQLHPDPERYQTIQKALADRGYFKGDVNGTWGDDSVDAMRRFQADQKIDNDGKIDSLSLISLGLGARHDGTTAAEPHVPAVADSLSSPGTVQTSSNSTGSIQPR